MRRDKMNVAHATQQNILADLVTLTKLTDQVGSGVFVQQLDVRIDPGTSYGYNEVTYLVKFLTSKKP
jgi:hypothetical protein